MGLAGRKVKQRIAADPRNLAWADDAAKFGLSYLSKFGWDSSKGLGVDGEGRTSHINVSRKLDMLGIGAAHQKDGSWKQNREFENVLERLNKASQQEVAPNLEVATAKAKKGESERDTASESEVSREKKRKRGKRSESGEKTHKKQKKSRDAEEASSSVVEDGKVRGSSPGPSRTFIPRARAHRARFIASKAIASKSSTSIAEILGFSTTSSPDTLSNFESSPGVLTPVNDETDISLDKLTTSVKSVADYFKEKLRNKPILNSSTLPSLAASDKHLEEVSFDDTLRGGIGSYRVQKTQNTESIETHRLSIGSTMLSFVSPTSFAASTNLSSGPEAASEDAANDMLHPVDEENDRIKQKKKRSKDKQKLEGDEMDKVGVREERRKKRKEKREHKSVETQQLDATKDIDKVRSKKKRRQKTTRN